MIKMRDITRVYRTEDVETTALNKVNLEVVEGEFIAVVGPSGCGKSTLMNIVGMLDSPSDGSYLFMGEDVARYSERQLSSLRKRNLGFVFQSFNLIDELTVFENVELPLCYQNITPSERRERVDRLLDQMGIAHRRNHYPLQLSGGQQQRVAVTRAVVIEPKLILADEPTGNLDSQNGEDVMNLLVDLNKKGTTIVMVTHSPDHITYADRTIKLFDGKVVKEEVAQV